jgi:hypothetical protein
VLLLERALRHGAKVTTPKLNPYLPTFFLFLFEGVVSVCLLLLLLVILFVCVCVVFLPMEWGVHTFFEKRFLFLLKHICVAVCVADSVFYIYLLFYVYVCVVFLPREWGSIPFLKKVLFVCCFVCLVEDTVVLFVKKKYLFGAARKILRLLALRLVSR